MGHETGVCSLSWFSGGGLPASAAAAFALAMALQACTSPAGPGGARQGRFASYLLGASGGPASATVLGGKVRETLAFPHSRYARTSLVQGHAVVRNLSRKPVSLVSYAGSPLVYRTQRKGGQLSLVPPFLSQCYCRKVVNTSSRVAPGASRKLPIVAYMNWPYVRGSSQMSPAAEPTLKLHLFNDHQLSGRIFLAADGGAAVSLRPPRRNLGPIYYSYLGHCSRMQGTTPLTSTSAPASGNWIETHHQPIRLGAALSKSCSSGDLDVYAGGVGFPMAHLMLRYKE